MSMIERAAVRAFVPEPETMMSAGNFTPRSVIALERPTSLADQVYARLSRSLREGECLPGQRMSARQLARDMNVSLTPVREAMLRLVSEGALEMRSAREFQAAKLDIDTYLELAGIRLALEPLAAEKAAAHIDKTVLGELTDLNEALGMAIRAERFSDAPALDTRFHQLIYEAARQPLLYSMIDSLLTRAGPTRTQVSHSFRSTLDGYERHKRVIEALRDCKPDLSRELVATDLKLGIASLTEVLRNRSDGGAL